MFFFVRPEISSSAKGCPRPKVPKTPVFCDFPLVGARSGKLYDVEELQKNIPDSVVQHFISISEPQLLWGPPRALRVWLLAC